MKYIFSLLMSVAICNACGPTVELPPQPDGGAGGASSSAESVSSSSSGQMLCDVEYIVSVCEDCKLNGCPMPMDSDEPCKRIGTIHYTDMLGCAELADGACPVCAGIKINMPIPLECSECAAQYTSCSFDCKTEVGE